MSSSTQPKRPRACENCQTLKIKCEGIIEGQPCQRCARLSKDCLPAVPKRQRDRVAELEAKVDALTKLLQAQGITDAALPPDSNEDEVDTEAVAARPASIRFDFERIDSVRTTPSASGTSEPAKVISNVEVASKKRRFDAAVANDPAGTSEPHSFDVLIPLDLQSRILRHYVVDVAAHFPAVPVSADISLETMRRSKPTLLRAILFAASPGSCSIDDQEEMANIILNEMATRSVILGEKSIELVQAMAIVCMWYRAPKHHTSLAVYQLVQLACGIATGIGLGGPQSSPSLEYGISEDDIYSPDAWRTWLVCHMLSTSMAILLRRTNASTWTNYHQHCVDLLQDSSLALPGDNLLCQIVIAERLCDQISTELALSDLDTAPDLRDLAPKMQALQAKIADWSAQIPADLQKPNLLIWQHVMTVYLHEPVLHTATNKQSFAGPFMGERVSITDFPNPAITAQHVTSLYSIRDAAHALIDTFCQSGPPEVMLTQPTIQYAARACYALYILAKLYVAVTAKGNTYGLVLPAADVRMDTYIQKLSRLADELSKIDPAAAPTRLTGSSIYMGKWFENYKASIQCTTVPTGVGDEVVCSEAAFAETTFDDVWLGDLFADINWSGSILEPNGDAET